MRFRVHNTVLAAFSPVHIKTLEKADMLWQNMTTVNIRFRCPHWYDKAPFSDVSILDSVLQIHTFSMQTMSIFDGFNVDGGPNASKSQRFQTKTH